jgi:hypothetical protein
VPAPGPLQASLKLGADEASAAMATTAKVAFNFSTLRDLWIRVELPSVPSTTTVDISITDPLGEPLRVFRRTFATEASTIENPDDVPLHILASKTIPGGFALQMQEPVAGARLARYGRTGTWAVTAHVSTLATPLVALMEVTQ